MVGAILAVSLTFGAVLADEQCYLKLDPETRKLLKEATQDKWLKRETILSTVIGGVLAALAGLAVQKYEARCTRDGEVRFTMNLLGALRRELEALSEIYDQNIGGILDKLAENQPLLVRFSLTENWFTVFESNAVQLGRLETRVSRQLIAVYTQLKLLIEEYRINNACLDQLDEFRLHPDPKYDLVLVEKETISRISAQTSRIRRADKALKSAVKQLFGTLTEKGIE